MRCDETPKIAPAEAERTSSSSSESASVNIVPEGALLDKGGTVRQGRHEVRRDSQNRSG